MEESLVRLQCLFRRHAETPECGAGELDRRLGAGGDQIAVDDRALVDVVVGTGVPGRPEEVLGRPAGVVASVEHAGSSEACRGTADRCYWNSGVQKARGSVGEWLPITGIPKVSARKDEEVTRGRVEVIEQHVGHDAQSAHS